MLRVTIERNNEQSYILCTDYDIRNNLLELANVTELETIDKHNNRTLEHESKYRTTYFINLNEMVGFYIEDMEDKLKNN